MTLLQIYWWVHGDKMLKIGSDLAELSPWIRCVRFLRHGAYFICYKNIPTSNMNFMTLKRNIKFLVIILWKFVNNEQVQKRCTQNVNLQFTSWTVSGRSCVRLFAWFPWKNTQLVAVMLQYLWCTQLLVCFGLSWNPFHHWIFRRLSLLVN